MINIIAAMGQNRAIGKDNKIPWHLPEDLRRFKELTTGHWVLMGRKTFESLGYKPLPNRHNVVVTRQIAKVPLEPGFTLTNSFEWILEKGANEDIFVIGGAEIYRQTVNRADMLYVTLVSHDFDGDAFFPEIDETVFELVEQSALQYGGKDAPYHYCYQRYRRK